MRSPALSCTALLLFLLASTPRLSAQDAQAAPPDSLQDLLTLTAPDNAPVAVTDEELRDRVENLSHEIPMEFNDLVKAHITAYTDRRRSSTEKIMGRTALYFPIFEQALLRHGLPTDLKYLAIIESALNPKAISPAGAAGLWQFMKGTAKQYDLRINKYVDERKDPYMASDAAARFLQDLYERYNDWALAIAAYNCGPGRVNQAIKAAQSSSYWDIIEHLPRETRNYVPAFIAAAYAANYYHLHGINPTFPDYELQVTEKLRVFDKLTFQEVAAATELPLETIKLLNPAYTYDYIPASQTGHLLILPLTKMEAFKAYMPEAQPAYFMASSIESGPAATLAARYAPGNTVQYEKIKKIYTVVQGDHLGKIAREHGASVSDIREWNNLNTSLLQIGQKLVVYEMRSIAPADEVLAASAPDTGAPSAALAAQRVLAASGVPPHGKRLHYYTVQRGDHLWQIARQYEGVTLRELMDWNRIEKHTMLRPGMELRVYL